VLLQEFDDAFQRLQSASPETHAELLVGLTTGYLNIKNQAASLENSSAEYRRQLAKQIRQHAKSKFHTNVGLAYALAFLSMHIEATALPGEQAETVRTRTMDLINIALLEVSKTQPAKSTSFYGPKVEPYSEVQRTMLLSLAEDIRRSEDALDKLITTVTGLGIIAATLRKEFGEHAVEAGCPAIEIVVGLSDGGDQTRARQLFDELIRNLDECQGDDYQTWLRLTWMFTPKSIEKALSEAKRSSLG